MRGLGIGLGIGLLLWPGGPAQAQGQLTESLPVSVLREAVRLGRTQALLHPPDEAQAAAQAVRGYLSALDPYSTYLSRGERLVLDDLDQPADYVGVGMEVIRAADRGLFCLPFDAGPAKSAGILPGDRLLAVDGRNIAHAPAETIPPLVLGPAGTGVVLTVAGPDGREREVEVVRGQVRRPVVEANFDGAMSKIRVYNFEAATKDLVEQGLELDPDRGPVLIDLRGNIGGELRAAVDTAGLFLPPGSLVATVAGRPGSESVQHRVGREGGSHAGRPVVIWQDHMTASASEVLIAALAQNGAAVSIGRRSFGKGLVQETFPAPGGGLYIITTGELLSPDGRSFNRRGLEPRLLIRTDSDDDFDYFTRTAEAFESLLSK